MPRGQGLAKWQSEEPEVKGEKSGGQRMWGVQRWLGFWEMGCTEASAKNDKGQSVMKEQTDEREEGRKERRKEGGMGDFRF